LRSVIFGQRRAAAFKSSFRLPVSVKRIARLGGRHARQL
jgi:hypothetical protein